MGNKIAILPIKPQEEFMRFIGRDKELEILNRVLKKNIASFIVIRGCQAPIFMNTESQV